MLSSKFNYKIKLSEVDKSDKKVFIVKVREVGRKNAKDPRDTIKLKDLSVQSIDDLLTRKSPIRKNKITKIKQRKTAIKNIEFKADEIQSIAGEDSDLILNSGIKFESKKGVPVDELNTRLLRF